VKKEVKFNIYANVEIDRERKEEIFVAMKQCG
jgi:hypothetical protein